MYVRWTVRTSSSCFILSSVEDIWKIFFWSFPMALVRKRSNNNPFACLGNSIPDEVPPQYSRPERRVINKSHSFSCMKPDDERPKTVPPPVDTSAPSFQFPSLSTASKELVQPNPCTSPFDSRDYQFVFRSKPISDSCPFDPYKVLLFVASAQGYHHSPIKNAVHMEDPRLSEQGVAQCKKVSNALRKCMAFNCFTVSNWL